MPFPWSRTRLASQLRIGFGAVAGLGGAVTANNEGDRAHASFPRHPDRLRLPLGELPRADGKRDAHDSSADRE